VLNDLVVKELKNTLRDKKILITTVVMPIIIFSIMGVIYSFGFSQTIKETVRKAEEANILVCDLDNGNYSSLIIDFLGTVSKNVSVTDTCTEEEIIQYVSNNIYTLVIVLPSGLSENLSALRPASFRILAAVKGLSFASMASTAVVQRFAEALRSYIRSYLIAVRGMDPEFVVNPLTPNTSIVFRGSEVSPETISALAGSSFLLVFAPLIVISTALGIASSSMAVENEEKTLEVLLTLPIPRFKIIAGKLLGTMVLVLLATASFMGGWYIYMSAIMRSMAFEEVLVNTTQSTGTLTAPVSLIDPFIMAVMGVSTFLSLVAVASLGLLLGSIAPDVRTSQTYIGQLSFLIIIPGFLLAFLDLSTLGQSGQIAMVVASPFIAPILIMKSYYEGISWVIPATVSWSLVFSVVMLFAASKLLGSEKLLMLQFRFLRRKLGKRKPKKGFLGRSRK
jgi:ABC-2 type transport system permease protein